MRPVTVPERAADCGELYRVRRHELMDLLRSLTPEQLTERVHATSAWTVHDAVCHVVGIVTDLNTGNFGREGSDQWTASQVESRRNNTRRHSNSGSDRYASTIVEAFPSTRPAGPRPLDRRSCRPTWVTPARVPPAPFLASPRRRLRAVGRAGTGSDREAGRLQGRAAWGSRRRWPCLA